MTSVHDILRQTIEQGYVPNAQGQPVIPTSGPGRAGAASSQNPPSARKLTDSELAECVGRPSQPSMMYTPSGDSHKHYEFELPEMSMADGVLYVVIVAASLLAIVGLIVWCLKAVGWAF